MLSPLAPLCCVVGSSPHTCNFFDLSNSTGSLLGAALKNWEPIKGGSVSYSHKLMASGTGLRPVDSEGNSRFGTCSKLSKHSHAFSDIEVSPVNTCLGGRVDERLEHSEADVTSALF